MNGAGESTVQGAMQGEAGAAVSRSELSRYAVRRAWHGFIRHRGIDSAATLAFFSALTVLPAALTIVSALSLGQGQREATDFVFNLIDSVARKDTVDVVRDPLTQLFSVSSPVIALIIGIVLSVWSMSSYATAFGRAANNIYEIQEGRQFVKFRALMILLSLFLLVAFAAVVVLLLTTRNAAEVFAHELGLGEPWVSVWVFGRWPVLFIVLTLIIAALFYATPNVRREKRRWLGVGAVFAIVVWAAATAIFGLYVSTVANYDRIYGWLGGALALLV
ncbi:MAG: YihY/virulence factor BrkB family protein, partial [Terrimesophilobacter sp.]